MISDSAALVMFAIRSSIKLGRQLRQTYVDSTKRRELVLRSCTSSLLIIPIARKPVKMALFHHR